MSAAGADAELVSVITPVRDEAALLGETAATILEQDWPALEFLFVDGGSRDGSRSLLADLAGADPRVRVLDNPDGDLASALRIGLDAARGDYVAKLDAHTYFPERYVRDGVERLRRGDVAWVSGPPVPFGVDPPSRRVAIALGTWLGVGGSAKWARSFEGADGGVAELELDTGVFSGVWRRSVLVGFGGWDPAWPVNEDAELASRFLAAGERILCVPSMAARYVPRRSLAGLARQYWRYGYYRAKTARRHPASLRRSHALVPAVTVVCALAVLGGRRGRRLFGPGVAAYATAVLAASASARHAAGPREAALLPPVYAAMHLGWGAGFLAGCARFGVPVRALAALARPGTPRR